jgi:hypothetical protein
VWRWIETCSAREQLFSIFDVTPRSISSTCLVPAHNVELGLPRFVLAVFAPQKSKDAFAG